MAKVTYQFPLGVKLGIEINTTKAQERIRSYQSHLQAQRQPILERLATIMREGFADRFREGGSPPWKPNAASTMLSKMGLLDSSPSGRRLLPGVRYVDKLGHGGPATPLAGGELEQSWTVRGAKNHIEKVDVTDDGGEVTVGSSDPKAAIHQYGVNHAFIIEATEGKTLRFAGSNGRAMYRKSVMHPGIAARPVTLTDSDKRRMVKTVEEMLEPDQAGH